MLNVSKPRKKVTKFKNISKYRKKSAKVYYIVEDDFNVYTNDITNHDINNPIPISTSY